MNTQSGAESPHICTALEHCHQLNERMADLGEAVARLERDADRWHNALASESRTHAAALATHRDAIDALERESRRQDVVARSIRKAVDELVAVVRRPAELGALEYHCETCICEATALRGRVSR